jgi:hypothetical protein
MQEAEQIISVLSLFTMKIRRKAMEGPFEQPEKIGHTEPQAMQDRDYYHAVHNQHQALLEHHHLLVDHQHALLAHHRLVQDRYQAVQNHAVNTPDRDQAMQAFHHVLQEHYGMLQEQLRLLREHARLMQDPHHRENQ